MSNYGMSVDMYNFIIENLHRLDYDLDNGLVITPKGTNGTVCSSTGYLRVKVNKRLLQVHQILAVMYFGESCIDMQINHKDGNKMNNKVSNLEAVTMAENLRHQKENGMSVFGNPVNKKSVDKLTLDGKYICTYSSISEAAREIELSSSKEIKYAIRGFDSKGKRRNTAKGFKWRFSQ